MYVSGMAMTGGAMVAVVWTARHFACYRCRRLSDGQSTMNDGRFVSTRARMCVTTQHMQGTRVDMCRRTVRRG